MARAVRTRPRKAGLMSIGDTSFPEKYPLGEIRVQTRWWRHRIRRMTDTSVARERYTLSIGFFARGIRYSSARAQGQKIRLMRIAWTGV